MKAVANLQRMMEEVLRELLLAMEHVEEIVIFSKTLK